MNSNLNTLFDDSKENNTELTKLPSQIRFEEQMELEVPMLIDIINNAFEEMRNQVNEMPYGYKTHLSKPIRMNELIKGKLTDHYGDSIKILRHNRFGLFKNGYVLLFKKFNSKGLPSNIRTRNSIMLTTKGKLNFEGEPEIVFIGFTVTPGYENLRTLKAVKILDEEVQWVLNLEGFAGDIRRNAQIVLASNTDSLVVSPKMQQQKKTG